MSWFVSESCAGGLDLSVRLTDRRKQRGRGDPVALPVVGLCRKGVFRCVERHPKNLDVLR